MKDVRSIGQVWQAVLLGTAIAVLLLGAARAQIGTAEQLDFGDAPDPSYPTLLASDGARHTLNTAILLGRYIDSESNGQPNADATGDDIAWSNDDYRVVDDEDGIVMSDPLVPGQAAKIQAVVSYDAGQFPMDMVPVLYGWIDFNADGDWNDEGENVIDSWVVNGENNTFEIKVPTDAVTGKSFARFRLRSEFSRGEVAPLTPTGAANDGEVEDYMVTIEGVDPRGQYDFGDAPASYGTLLVDNGARHTVNPDFQMTALVMVEMSPDVESDGQPSERADGDDVNGLDDENGVQFATELKAGETATINIGVINRMVTIGTAAPRLAGWIDFNQDGDFTDEGEQVIAAPARHGDNSFVVTVPAGAVRGRTYARFRLAMMDVAEQNMAPSGLLPVGEVEDYLVEVIGIDETTEIKITGIFTAPGGSTKSDEVEVFWSSEAGWDYSVERCTSLMLSDWDWVTGATNLPGVVGEMSATIVENQNTPCVFYRVSAARATVQ